MKIPFFSSSGSGFPDSLNELVPTQKTVASCGVLTSSFFLLQNVAQRLLGRIGLQAGRALPITTCLGLAVTSMNMCASNYAALEFENFWDRDIDKLPSYKGKIKKYNYKIYL